MPIRKNEYTILTARWLPNKSWEQRRFLLAKALGRSDRHIHRRFSGRYDREHVLALKYLMGGGLEIESKPDMVIETTTSKQT